VTALHRPYRLPLDGPAHLVRLTPDEAGWDWVGLQVLRLGAAVTVTVDTEDNECFVLPLSGGPVAVAADHGSGVVRHELAGRESIYYYRIQGEGGFGYHRTYTGPEHGEAGLAPIDETLEVHDHDVVLVPHGYHGPCMAAPDYPMYYLNVMAGPASERSMAFCDDPAHAWIRGTWMASA
jgi:5-deoxy-D-glucuronate isomerase